MLDGAAELIHFVLVPESFVKLFIVLLRLLLSEQSGKTALFTRRDREERKHPSHIFIQLLPSTRRDFVSPSSSFYENKRGRT